MQKTVALNVAAMKPLHFSSFSALVGQSEAWRFEPIAPPTRKWESEKPKSKETRCLVTLKWDNLNELKTYPTLRLIPGCTHERSIPSTPRQQ